MALFGQPTKNAIVITIARPIPIAINRLFIEKIKNSQIKRNGIFIPTIFTFKCEVT
jgi:hypothetical protein